MNIIKSIAANLKGQCSKAEALLKSSVMLQKAIDEAERKYQKKGHRYYVIYDPNKKKLTAITYDIYYLRTDSYIYLRRRGRFGKPLSRNELKTKCFYYTPSKNVPDRRCTGEDKKRRLLLWQRYYSLCLYKK